MIGTAYVITDLRAGNYATWDQLIEMDADGWSIASHGKTHVNFTTLTQEEVQAEISAAKAALDAQGLTNASSHLSYPYGAYDATVLAAVAAEGILTARNSVEEYFDLSTVALHEIPAYHVTNLTTLEALKSIVLLGQNCQGTVIMFHKIVTPAAEEYDFSVENFQAFIDFLVANHIKPININTLYTLILTAQD